MFSPVLRARGTDRMVYSTSIGVRLVFLGTLLVVILSIASVPEGTFLSRLNWFSVLIVALCVLGILYLDRWVFDKKSNFFEKQTGILFLYRRKRAPLDVLQKVVLHETGTGQEDGSRVPGVGLTSRKIAVLTVVDKEERAFRLDTARGSAVRDLHRSAERLCAFCALPLERDAGSTGHGVST